MLFPENKAALRMISRPVRAMNDRARRLIVDLKETLLACSGGVGLAAPQINEHLRVVVVRLDARNEWDHEAGPPIALVNPKIIELGEEQKDFDGCLSFPGLYGETIRPHFLRISALDEDGNPVDQIYQGFDAVVVHHEIDHLNGILFIDHVTNLNDLYMIAMDDQGRLVRVLLPDIVQIWKKPGESLWILKNDQLSERLKEMVTEVANEREPGSRLDDA